MPALLWATGFVWIRGLPNTIYEIYKRGWDASNIGPYIKVQFTTLWRGPLLLVYYVFRASVFLLLLPYNILVFIFNWLYLPMLVVTWSAYVLRALLWYADAAYVLSKFFLNNPSQFVTTFFWLITDDYLFRDILFFWFWIPAYGWYMFLVWIYEDTFQRRPT